MTKDILEQINNIKKRLLIDSRYESHEAFKQLESLIVYLKNLKFENKNMLLKYIPISITVIIQSYFRAIIAELINSGTPFISRLNDLKNFKNFKIDFKVLTAIDNKLITLGEFVSYLFNFNNLEEINSCMSILLNNHFLNELRNFDQYNNYIIDEDKQKDFQTNADSILKDISKIFEMRHIFAHELATSVNFKEAVIYRCFDSALNFLNVTENYIIKLMHPNYSMSQFEFSEYIYNELTNKKSELQKIKKEIKDSIEDDMKGIFDKSNLMWEKFVNLEVKAIVKLYEGGTVYGIQHSSIMITKINDRIENLKRDYKEYLQKIQTYEIL